VPLLPSMSFDSASEFDHVVRLFRLTNSLGLSSAEEGSFERALMGLASLPYSAFITGKLRGCWRKPTCVDSRSRQSSLQRFGEKPKEIVRFCLDRTSLHPQVFPTSRCLVLSDASQTCFSLVALVGLAPFRGFSSLVADVARFRETPNISFRRSLAESLMPDLLSRGCLPLLAFAQLGCLSPLSRHSATCLAHLQGF